MARKKADLKKGMTLAAVHRLLGPEIGEEFVERGRVRHRIYERLVPDRLATADVWFRDGKLTMWRGEVEQVIRGESI